MAQALSGGLGGAATRGGAAGASPVGQAVAMVRGQAAGVARECLTTLTKIIDNILTHPMEEKYRKIKRSNAGFRRKVCYVHERRKEHGNTINSCCTGIFCRVRLCYSGEFHIYAELPPPLRPPRLLLLPNLPLQRLMHKVGGVPGGEACMRALGFVEADGDQGSWVLQPSAAAWNVLTAGRVQIQSALATLPVSGATTAQSGSSGAGSSPGFAAGLGEFPPPGAFPGGFGGAGGMGGGMGAGLGGGMPDMATVQRMMQDPATMQNMMNDPSVQAMMSTNPQMAGAMRVRGVSAVYGCRGKKLGVVVSRLRCASACCKARQRSAYSFSCAIHTSLYKRAKLSDFSVPGASHGQRCLQCFLSRVRVYRYSPTSTMTKSCAATCALSFCASKSHQIRE